MSDEEKWASNELNPETWEEANRMRQILELMEDQIPQELEDMDLEDMEND